MFDFLKRKTKEDERPEIYRCSICNGRYHKENINLLESAKAGKNVCVRCARYIEKMDKRIK